MATSDRAKIEALMRDIDRSLLRENLKLTFERAPKSICARCKWSRNCGALEKG